MVVVRRRREEEEKEEEEEEEEDGIDAINRCFTLTDFNLRQHENVRSEGRSLADLTTGHFEYDLITV